MYGSSYLRVRSSRNCSPWNAALGAGRNCRLVVLSKVARPRDENTPKPSLALESHGDGARARAGGLRQPAADGPKAVLHAVFSLVLHLT